MNQTSSSIFFIEQLKNDISNLKSILRKTKENKSTIKSLVNDTFICVHNIKGSLLFLYMEKEVGGISLAENILANYEVKNIIANELISIQYIIINLVEKIVSKLEYLESSNIEIDDYLSKIEVMVHSNLAIETLNDIFDMDIKIVSSIDLLKSALKNYRDFSRRDHVFKSQVLEKYKMDIILNLNNTFVNIEKIFNNLNIALEDVAFKQNKQVKISFESDNVAILIDRSSAIYKVLYQIGKNALTHGFCIDRLILNEINFKAYNINSNVVIEVINNGKRIDFAVLEAKAKKYGINYLRKEDLLFESKLSSLETKNDYSGAGIGLSGVKNFIMDDLKGKIEVTSDEFLTKIKLIFPCAI